MADSGTRILVTVNGSSRTILSISENLSNSISQGDLYISMMPAENYGGSDPRQKGKPAHGQKFTVHNSRDSEFHNTMKLTIELKDGTKRTSVQQTKAIKVNKLFAPLFIRYYPDLSNIRYNTTSNKKKKSEFSLGDYDPSSFSMIFCAAVGPAHSNINDHNDKDFSIKTLNFNNFTVTIIWCYVGQILSLPVGNILHFFTLKDEEVSSPGHLKFQNELMEGYTEQKYIELFYMMREYLRKDMCQFHKNYLYYLSTTRFFRRGVKKGGPWERYVRGQVSAD